MRSELDVRARRDNFLKEIDEITAEFGDYSTEKMFRAQEYIEYALREIKSLNWVLGEE